ncbi:ubiquinol-cytochrome-c reductase complex assembly factor 3-like [Elgaria multicarinata webbii]|uniref:ubiquinol-cytochrome-c reductase complex assembly factor 3-like n=1 Tax=Elgaria multicarinata webbii TaxID=159646 RepID=UPI002FCCF482
MGTASRVISGLLAMAGSLGLAGVLWIAIVPNRKRMEEMDKEFRESNPRLWTERQKQNTQIMAILKEAAETNENVASKPWPWRK